MLQTAKDVGALRLDPLIHLLESIESFLNHLDIGINITHTAAMTETLAKILVELLSILGLATRLIKQRQPGEYLIAGISSDSMQSRDICKEAPSREFRPDGAGKVGSIHRGRGFDYHIPDY